MKFDVLRDGESDLLGNGGLDDSDPIQDNLVTNDDLSDFVRLKPVEFDVDVTQGMLKEERCDVHVWVGLVPAVKGASSTDSRERYASCRCTYAARIDCSSGNGALRCGRRCSRKAAVS